MIEDLDVRASWDLLRAHDYGRVAVTRLGQPEVYPVNDRTFPPLVPENPWVPGPRSAIVDITPTEMTGRRFRRPA